MAVSGSVENAIESAKMNGKWTEADTKVLNALNGGANWGKTMDEFAFDSTKAAQYKNDLPEAKKQNELAQARKRNNNVPSTAKTVGKYAGAALAVAGTVAGVAAVAASAVTLPAWAPLAAIGAGALLFQSCSSDISANQKQAVNITIPKAKDYTEQLNKIIDLMDKLNSDQAARFKELLQNLQIVIQNQYDSKEALGAALNSMFAQIKGWLERIIQNQVSMQIDNNQNAQDILNALNKIMNSGSSYETQLADVMKLLNQIKSVGESIDNTTKSILEQIKTAKEEIKNTLNTNNKAVLDALAKLNDNDQVTLDILNDIKGMISKYGTQGNNLAEAILVAIGKVNASDLSGIEALLKQLVQGQKQTNTQVADLTKLFNNFSDATATQLNTIISKLDKSSPNYEAQLNAIIKLLEQLDANNDARNKKVLDAIAKLGNNVTASLNAIYAKIGQGGTTAPDYTAILNAILDKLDGMQKDNNKNFAAILNAIGNIDIKPQDLSWIKGHLDAILEAIKDHDVVVTVEGGKCCCCKDGGIIHEGVLGDLNDLLG